VVRGRVLRKSFQNGFMEVVHVRDSWKSFMERVYARSVCKIF
jgi:hypothetical protein